MGGGGDPYEDAFNLYQKTSPHYDPSRGVVSPRATAGPSRHHHGGSGAQMRSHTQYAPQQQQQQQPQQHPRGGRGPSPAGRQPSRQPSVGEYDRHFASLRHQHAAGGTSPGARPQAHHHHHHHHRNPSPLSRHHNQHPQHHHQRGPSPFGRERQPNPAHAPPHPQVQPQPQAQARYPSPPLRAASPVPQQHARQQHAPPGVLLSHRPPPGRVVGGGGGGGGGSGGYRAASPAGRGFAPRSEARSESVPSFRPPEAGGGTVRPDWVKRGTPFAQPQPQPQPQPQQRAPPALAAPRSPSQGYAAQHMQQQQQQQRPYANAAPLPLSREALYGSSPGGGGGGGGGRYEQYAPAASHYGAADRRSVSAAPQQPLAPREVPALQVVGGGAVDISELIEQRSRLDGLIQKYEAMRSDASASSAEQIREQKWRRDREQEIERLRRENQEREGLLEMERRRLCDMESQLEAQRLRNGSYELEVKQHRLLVEEKYSAMAADFRTDRRRAAEREAAYSEMNIPVDATLERRRRELEDSAHGVRHGVGHERKKAAALLRDELLAQTVDMQRAEIIREQQQRDMIAWKREEQRDLKDKVTRQNRMEMLLSMQTKHYTDMVRLAGNKGQSAVGPIGDPAAEAEKIEAQHAVLRKAVCDDEGDARAAVAAEEAFAAGAAELLAGFLRAAHAVHSEEAAVDLRTAHVRGRAEAAERERRSTEDEMLRVKDIERRAAEQEEQRRQEQAAEAEKQAKLLAAQAEEDAAAAAAAAEKAEAEKRAQEEAAAATAAAAAADAAAKKEAEDAARIAAEEKAKVEAEKAEADAAAAAAAAATAAAAEAAAEKAAEKPAEKAEKPAEKPAEKSAEKPKAPAPPAPPAPPTAPPKKEVEAKAEKKAEKDEGASARIRLRDKNNCQEFYDTKKQKVYYQTPGDATTQQVDETIFLDDKAVVDAQKLLIQTGLWVEKKKDNGKPYYYRKSDKTVKKPAEMRDVIVEEAREVVKRMAKALRKGEWVPVKKDGKEVLRTADKKTTIDPEKLYDATKEALHKEQSKELEKGKDEKDDKKEKKSKSEKPAAPSAPPTKSSKSSKSDEKDLQKKVDKVIKAGNWKLNKNAKTPTYYRRLADGSTKQLKEKDFREQIAKDDISPDADVYGAIVAKK